MRFLNAVREGRTSRQYPGWRDRHACTLVRCTGPRKWSWFSGAASQHAWLSALLAALQGCSE